MVSGWRVVQILNAHPNSRPETFVLWSKKFVSWSKTASFWMVCLVKWHDLTLKSLDFGWVRYSDPHLIRRCRACTCSARRRREIFERSWDSEKLRNKDFRRFHLGPEKIKSLIYFKGQCYQAFIKCNLCKGGIQKVDTQITKPFEYDFLN